MIASSLLLTIQVLLAQAPAEASGAPAPTTQEQAQPEAEAPSSEPAATGLDPSARPSLLPGSAQPKRPSRAWGLVRVPVAVGAGAVAGLVSWAITYPVISVATWPFGCFTIQGGRIPDWCHNVANFGAFLVAGVGSGAAVAGIATLLHGEADARIALVAGLLGGIGFGTVYVLGDYPDQLTNFQGEQARVHRIAFVAMPALAILSYELGALLFPARPSPLTPAVAPTAGGAILLVGGRF